MSRNSEKVGRQFEKLLTDYHLLIEGLGHARVHKIPTPLKVLKPLGKGMVQARLESRFTVDYGGTLRGGRSVWFEAKFMASKDSRYRLPFSRVQPHQLFELQRQCDFGALSFVLAKHQHEVTETFLIRTELLQERLERGDRSITWLELTELGCNLKPNEGWYQKLVRTGDLT